MGLLASHITVYIVSSYVLSRPFVLLHWSLFFWFYAVDSLLSTSLHSRSRHTTDYSYTISYHIICWLCIASTCSEARRIACSNSGCHRFRFRGVSNVLYGVLLDPSLAQRSAPTCVGPTEPSPSDCAISDHRFRATTAVLTYATWKTAQIRTQIFDCLTGKGAVDQGEGRLSKILRRLIQRSL